MFPGYGSGNAGSSIPLDYRPPQFNLESPVTALGQAMTLGGMAQAQQLNAQRIEEEKLRVQQAARDQQDQDTLAKTWMDNGGDYDKTRAAALGNVQMKTVQQLDNDHNMQQRAAASLSTQKRQEQIAGNEMMAQAAARIKSLPQEQRAAATQAEIAGLKQYNVDASTFRYDPNSGPSDDQLDTVMAGTRYQGQILSQAQKKDQADKLAADTAEAQRRRKLAAAADSYTLVTNQDQHDAWLKSDEAKAADYDKDKFPTYGDNNQSILDSRASTPDQRVKAGFTQQQRDTQAQRVADQAAIAAGLLDAKGRALELQSQLIGVKQQLADQSGAFHAAQLNGGAGNPKLTPGQMFTEERNISAIEDGTSSRPGLNDRRLALGTQLNNNKDDKGHPVYDDKGKLTTDGQTVTSQFKAATNNLQKQQYRKAKLYGLGAPDPEEVNAAKEGDEVQAEDGSTWVKKDGVAFFKSMAGAAPPQGKPATSTQPPTPAPGPAKGAAPPKSATTRVLTQADVDRAAKAGHTGYKVGQTLTFDGTTWR